MPLAHDPTPNWLFLDMNCFFASAEQHLRPELRGRPVGVIPVETEGTCVIAASIDAKARGVRTGTSVPDARRLCPGIALVKARPPVYVDLHHAIMRSIDRCAPIHRTYSIDEWAIRLTGPDRNLDRAMGIARDIKARILADFTRWLPCSVGVSQTRLLAKTACELKKPDGLTSLFAHEVPTRLRELKPTDIPGVGGGISKRLADAGVTTIPGLWRLPRHEAAAVWGSVEGARWWDGFHGRDEPEISTRKGSMSHANILEPRLRSPDGARRMLIRLITRLGLRLRTERYLAGALAVQVRPSGAPPWSASIDLPHVNDTPTLLAHFYRLWAPRAERLHAPIQVGATVSGLVHDSQLPAFLFDQPHGHARLSAAMDTINRRWGHAAIYVASMHGCCYEMDDKIAFGRIPPGAIATVATRTQPLACAPDTESIQVESDPTDLLAG